jgi:hypothetical protein
MPRYVYPGTFHKAGRHSREHALPLQMLRPVLRSRAVTVLEPSAQLWRLRRFCAQNPTVVIKRSVGFGFWQAWMPSPLSYPAAGTGPLPPPTRSPDAAGCHGPVGSAIPGHRVAGKGQPKARPGRGAGTGDSDRAGQHTSPARRPADKVVPSRAAPGQRTSMATTRRAAARMPCTRRHAPARAGPGPSPAASQTAPELARAGSRVVIRAGQVGRLRSARAGSLACRREVLTGTALRSAGSAHARPSGRRFRGASGGSRPPGPQARRRRRRPR